MEYIVIFALGIWFGSKLHKTPEMLFKTVSKANKRAPKAHGDYEEVQAELRANDPGKANIR